METQSIRMWKVPKPIREEIHGKPNMAIYLANSFVDELAHVYPSTYLKIMYEYRMALKNQCFYRIFNDSVRIVCLGAVSNQITTFEFTCKKEDDMLMIVSVFEGQSSAGDWKSVKKEARK